MTDQSKLSGRKIFTWRGADDTIRLTEAVAEVAIAELFELNGNLIWHHEGRQVTVTKDVLREIVRRYIVSLRWVNSGTADKPNLTCEYFSFGFPLEADTSKEPNEWALIDMIAALLGRVAKGPSEPRRLLPQQELDARARLKQGERPDSIARAYNIDVGTIARLTR